MLDGWAHALSSFRIWVTELPRIFLPPQLPTHACTHAHTRTPHTSAGDLCVRVCMHALGEPCLKNLNKEPQQKQAKEHHHLTSNYFLFIRRVSDDFFFFWSQRGGLCGDEGWGERKEEVPPGLGQAGRCGEILNRSKLGGDADLPKE